MPPNPVVLVPSYTCTGAQFICLYCSSQARLYNFALTPRFSIIIMSAMSTQFIVMRRLYLIVLLQLVQVTKKSNCGFKIVGWHYVRLTLTCCPLPKKKAVGFLARKK